MKQLSHALWIGSIALLVIGISVSYGSLPEQLPIRFEVTGEPSEWMDTSMFILVYLALITPANLMPLFCGKPLERLWEKTPRDMIQMPNRNYWFANKKRRWQALAIFQTTVFVVTTCINLILVMLFFIIRNVSINQAIWPPPQALALVVIFLFVFVFAYPLYSLRVPKE